MVCIFELQVLDEHGKGHLLAAPKVGENGF